MLVLVVHYFSSWYYFLLELFLGFSDPGDLRERVDNRGHTVVVDVRSAALSDRLHAHNALVLGLVRQHGALNAVTNGVDVGHIRLELVVGGDATSVVGLDAHVLQTQVHCVRSTADANQQRVAVDRFFLSRSFHRLELHSNLVARLLGRCDFRLQSEFDSLFGEDLLEGLRYLHVDALTSDVWQKLDAGHIRSQSRPN